MTTSSIWRNESTTSFDVDGAGQVHLRRAMEAMRNGPDGVVAKATDVFFEVLHRHLPDPKRSFIQEVVQLAGTLRVNLVCPTSETLVRDSVVGGGIGISVEENDGVAAELWVYLHRLVCTNGMVRCVEAAGQVHVATLELWGTELDHLLPKLLDGISVGMTTLCRSAQVRLGVLRPLVPVMLDYFEIRNPDRALVLESFEAEPGDTLWHFINAFSRAANRVLLAHDVAPDVAIAKRRRLQRSSLRVCEHLLEGLTSGRSLLTVAGELRGMFQED